MNTVCSLTENDRKLLLGHYSFYQELDLGARAPTTQAQEHFVSVCRGISEPTTEHEKAYWQFKQLLAAKGFDEKTIVEARFIFPDVPTVTSVAVFTELGRACIDCGCAIPPLRLEAIPDATRCLTCQKKADAPPSDWRNTKQVCPLCAKRGIKSTLVWRTARDADNRLNPRDRDFLGCSRFPECRYQG